MSTATEPKAGVEILTGPRILPDFFSLTEFDKYHGDCFWLAFLCGMHAIDPQGYPLTLQKLDEITADAIAHGYADAKLSGGVNIPNANRYLADHHIPHTTVGYDEFAHAGIEAFHTFIKENAGKKPIIVEWAHGGHFHGDEPGVDYHYSTIGGIDPGKPGSGGLGYLFADGDDRGDKRTPTPPILHPWSEIVSAQPIGYIVLEGQRVNPPPPPPPPSKLDLTGLGPGMAKLAEQHHASQTSGGEFYFTDSESWAGLNDGTVAYYNKHTNVVSDKRGDYVAHVLWTQREEYRKRAEAAEEQLAALKQQGSDVKLAALQSEYDTLGTAVKTAATYYQQHGGK